MSGAFDGRVVVITGGSAGIGLAAATRFREGGATVVIVGRRQSELDKAVANLGSGVEAVQADVSNLADLDRLYSHIADVHGHIDVLCANAGIVERESLGSYTEGSIDRQLAVNVKGLIFTVEKAVPLIVDGGSIVVTSSVAHETGGPGMAVYAATRAAARNLVRSWFQELGARGIRVNSVSPASTETPGLANLAGETKVEDFFAYLAKQMPGGRNLKPEEIAGAITFLASDEARAINGTDLFVDGGKGQR